MLPQIATEGDYRARFRDPEFGLAEAQTILARHGLGSASPSRKVEGSNLVFRIDERCWLKIAPPFWSDALQAETEALRLLQGRLPVAMPALLASGAEGAWLYVIVSHVAGLPFRDAAADLQREDRAAIAEDLARVCREIHATPPGDFTRPLGPWGAFLERTIAQCEEIHRRRGASAAWAERAAAFVREEAEALRRSPGRLLHADLTSEHVLLAQRAGRWRVSGLIDFADAMVGPAEYEFVVPFLQFFRADRDAQRRFLDAYGLPVAERGALGRRLLATTLCHRFIGFHEWFAEELGEVADMNALAARVFPV